MLICIYLSIVTSNNDLIYQAKVIQKNLDSAKDMEFNNTLSSTKILVSAFSKIFDRKYKVYSMSVD